MTYFLPQRDAPLALVVDDELSLRLSMSAALSKAGFEVIEAENGREALALFQSHTPDLVLLDVLMPEMDGFETCSAIRKMPEGQYTQILMVTGLDDSDSIEYAFEVGANDFVAKPLNWVMLGHRGRYMLRAGRAFHELNSSERRLAKTQELAKLGNWELDLINNSFNCAPEACRLLGLDDEKQATYNDFLGTIIPSERNQVKQQIDAAIQSKTSFSSYFRVTLPDGVFHHILNRGEILCDENGIAEIVLGAVQDVTQLKHAEEEIRRLAFYDSLTGLANRMLFMDRLNYEITSAERNKSFFALLFLDLDQFKRVNDTCGHYVGDLLLKNVSETLQKCIRSSDTASGPVTESSDALIARFGGDEFIILLPDISEPERAAIVAQRVLREMPRTHQLDGHDISVTTSIGISVYPADGGNSEVLLKHADSAMYHAKETGRNNYQFYKESLNAAVLERFSLEQDIRGALKREEFLLYYQPQIDLTSHKIIGAEALIRWVHPLKGLIPPDKFIPIAEESGLIVDINKWVIQTACNQNRIWKKAGFDPVRIAVNLSGYQLAKQNIIQVIRDALQGADLDAKYLEIEITENILMQDNEDTVWILQGMKDLGLRIALDDFGTGYSSLNYLTSFPVDVIKIDRSFVMGLPDLKNNLVIIKTIIAMGHSLGMRIVAEGIETEEQLALLKGFRADEGQGCYFSQPVPHDEFTRFLKEGSI